MPNPVKAKLVRGKLEISRNEPTLTKRTNAKWQKVVLKKISTKTANEVAHACWVCNALMKIGWLGDDTRFQ